MLQVEKFSYHKFGPFSFSVEAGEVLGLTGPSGSGKTLLLRALCDLDSWEGRVELHGRAPHEMDAPQWRRRVGYVPAESAWWFDTVARHFETPPEEEMLSMFGFAPDVADWLVTRLSSGEKQRLSLCRTLCREPAALLLDEPTAHLDKENVQKTEDAVCRYVREHTIPVVWVTHNKEQIGRLARRAYALTTDHKLEEL